MTLKAKTKAPFLIQLAQAHENLLKGKDTQSSLQASHLPTKQGIIFSALSPNTPFLDIFIIADFSEILKYIRGFIICDCCFGEGLLYFDYSHATSSGTLVVCGQLRFWLKVFHRFVTNESSQLWQVCKCKPTSPTSSEVLI